MKTKVLVAVSFFMANLAHAQTPQWTWETGKQTNNAATTLKAASGSTASALQNPTAAAVKINQAATTQPPTIVTTAGVDFSAKIWCGVPDNDPELNANGWIGLGDYDPTTKILKGYLMRQGAGFYGINRFTGQIIFPALGGGALYSTCAQQNSIVSSVCVGPYVVAGYVVETNKVPISMQRCYP